MRTSIARLAVIVALYGALGLGCGDDKGPAAPGVTADTTGVLEPDFSLTDANPNSATSGQMVSPRQYLGRVSAWYFGHST